MAALKRPQRRLPLRPGKFEWSCVPGPLGNLHLFAQAFNEMTCRQRSEAGCRPLANLRQNTEIIRGAFDSSDRMMQNGKCSISSRYSAVTSRRHRARPVRQARLDHVLVDSRFGGLQESCFFGVPPVFHRLAQYAGLP